MPVNAVRPSRVLYLVVLLGLVFLFFGIRQTFRTVVFIAGAAHAPGTVTDLIARPSGQRSAIVYCPRFTFQTPNGHAISIVSKEGSNPAAFHPGDRIVVRYDPQHPDSALISSFEQTWGGDLLLLLLGVFLTLTPGLLLFRARL